MEYLNIKEDPAEKRLERFCSRITHVLGNLFHYCAMTHPKLSGLYHTVKPKKGEFGYYFNSEVWPLYSVIKHLKVKKVVDLGSGAGLLVVILNLLFEAKDPKKSIYVDGVENERVFLEISQRIQGTRSCFKFGNIKTLSKEFCESYDCFYWWEPIVKEEPCRIFISNLVRNMKSNSYIIAKPAACSGELLEKQPDLKAVGYYGCYCIYCKK